MAKWIDIVDCGRLPGRKTKRWQVLSAKSGGSLGIIYWWGPWRQFVFEPDGASRIIFEEDCLTDIADFIRQATAEHKDRKACQSD